MKLRIISRWTLMMLVVAGFFAVAVTGCDDEGDGGVGPASEGPIAVSGIIVNPKSPAPGDTIQLTAVVVSDSANVGLFPSISWSASGGTFLESDQTSVRWIAPDVSTLVTVSVRATNAFNTASGSTPVFVGQSSVILDSGAGQVFLTGTTPDHFYFLTFNSNENLDVSLFNDGTVTDATEGQSGDNLALSSSLVGAAFERDDPVSGNVILAPINVWYSVLATETTPGTTTQITFDGSEENDARREQYYNPTVSNDGTMIAYQGLLPTEAYTTQEDSFDVFVYYTQTMETVNLTKTHDLPRKNHLPTFSTDDNWLLFISDRAAAGVRWEYYALPVTGGEVDTAQASVVQVTNSNSQIVSVSQGVVNPPTQSWNPVSPVLALVMTNASLMQITMGPQGATTAITPLLLRPRTFVWSPDGSMLAFGDGTALYTVPTGGTGATLVHSAAAGDVLDDMVWSPNMDYMVYRVSRGGASWFEIKELDNPDAESIVLTPAESTGELGSYRSSMAMSPIWLDSNELMLLQFDGDTPGIDLLDISAAIQ